METQEQVQGPSGTQGEDKKEKSTIHEAKWQLNEPIDVDTYTKKNDSENNSSNNSIPKITKIESLQNQPSKLTITDNSKVNNTHKSVYKSLGFRGQVTLNYVQTESRRKRDSNQPKEFPELDQPKARSCRSLHITNMPQWYNPSHVQSLIQLMSDFNTERNLHFIDLFKDEKNKYNGECLIKFVNNKDCVQVYKDLYGISFMSCGEIKVNLDLDHRISQKRTVKDFNDVKATERFKKFSEAYAQYREQLRKTQENSVAKQESDEDDVEFIESAVETQVIDDDSDNIDAAIAANVVNDVTVKDEFNKECHDDNSAVALEMEEEKRLTNEDDSDDDSYLMYDRNCKIVLVKNLPTTKGDKENLKTLMRMVFSKNESFTYSIQSVKNNGKPTGDCLLRFVDHEQAAEVCKMLNGANLFNHPIEAILAKGFNIKKPEITSQDINRYFLKRKRLENDDIDEDELPIKRPRTDKEETHTPADTSAKTFTKAIILEDENKKWFGLHKRFVTRLGIKALHKLNRIITVTNLLPQVDKNKLYEVFSLAGDVKNITFIPSEQEDLSMKGLEADIEFDHVLEAIQAISLFHNKDLYGKKMHVTMAKRSGNPSKTVKNLPDGLSCIGRGLGNNGEIVRALRTKAERREIDEYLFELDVMNRHIDEKFATPFLFSYTKRKDFPHLTRNDVDNTVVSNSSTNANTSRASKKKAAKNDDKIPEGTLLAIKALGSVLKSKGLIPTNTQCSNLEQILNALQKNPVGKSNKLHAILPSENQVPDTPRNESPNRNFNQSLSNALNLPQNRNTLSEGQGFTVQATPPPPQNDQNVCSILPNETNALTQAVNQLIQCFSSNNVAPSLQPNVTQNFQNGDVNQAMANLNQIIGSVQNNLSTNMTNVGANVTANQSMPLLATPGSMNTMQQAANLYDSHPLPSWEEGPNMGQVRPNPYSGTYTLNPMYQPARPCMPPRPFLHPGPPFHHMQPIYPNPNNNNMIPPAVRTNLKEVPTNSVVPIVPMQPVAPTKPVEPTQMNVPTLPSLVVPTKPNVPTKPVAPTQLAAPNNASNSKPAKDFNPALLSQKCEMLVFNNLPPSVTKEALTRKMLEVGPVGFSELTGKGRAFVRFKFPQDTERCIRLFHRSKVDGQVIEVTYL